MKHRFLFFLFLSLFSLLSGYAQNQPEKNKYPIFWTWLDYRPGMNFDSVCSVMKETGLDGLLLNAPTPDDYRAAIPIAHKYGIEVYAWLWTMNLEHDRDSILKVHPEWFSVNRKGESLANTKAYVDYYKFLCPAIPEVREYIKDKIRSYCEVEGLNGIAIDYHRFVDVVLPTTLWPRYGIVQDREYPQWDFGYHPALIEKFEAKYNYDPRKLKDPSTDEKWLQFRCDQITEVANEIAEVVHSYGKKMAASPFPTPAMARQMVRQDWGKWNLDIVFPMVYHSFYTGDLSFISDCTIDNVKQKNPMTTLYCGMMATNSPVMFQSMDSALNNGAKGIAIFTIGSLRSPEVRTGFKAYADSVRNLRAMNPLNTATAKPRKVNTNPFENKGIMNAARLHMQAYLSLAKASKRPDLKNTEWEEMKKIAERAMQVNSAQDYINRLTRAMFPNQKISAEAVAIADQFKNDAGRLKLKTGKYRLTDEYRVTKHYQVTDEVSKVVFNVTFYFYGGVISGWSVSPDESSFDKYRKKV